MIVVLVNSICVLICTSIAIKLAIQCYRNEMTKLYILEMLLFKCIDKLAGKEGFCFNYIKSLNEGNNEKEDT